MNIEDEYDYDKERLTTFKSNLRKLSLFKGIAAITAGYSVIRLGSDLITHGSTTNNATHFISAGISTIAFCIADDATKRNKEAIKHLEERTNIEDHIINKKLVK